MRVRIALALCALLVLSGVADAELVGVAITPPILVTFDAEVTYDADGGAGGNGLLTVYAPFDPWAAFKSHSRTIRPMESFPPKVPWATSS